MLEYCAKKSYQVGYVLSDVASGMSDDRAKVRRLIGLASEGRINRVVVEHKDRLSCLMVGVLWISLTVTALRWSGSKSRCPSLLRLSGWMILWL